MKRARVEARRRAKEEGRTHDGRDAERKIERERKTDDEAGRESVQRTSIQREEREYRGRRNLLQDGASRRANNTIR